MLLNILRRLHLRIDRNRLGEVLVQDGVINRVDLKRALKIQKEECLPLGEILVKYKYVTRFTVQLALFEQVTYRCVAAMITILVSFSAMGPKHVRAADLNDIPAHIALVEEQASPMMPVNYYPALFESKETKSNNLRPFKKWISVFERLDNTLKNEESHTALTAWQSDLDDFRGLPLSVMTEKVNKYINQYPYITDTQNWAKSDYWATPLEFFERGGDCEDFAIAKYASLRMLGVPEERLRLAIVHDKKKNIPHAILIVYGDQGPMVLDNQRKKMMQANKVNRYKPIYSINSTSWWLHTLPSETGSTMRVASAE